MTNIKLNGGADLIVQGSNTPLTLRFREDVSSSQYMEVHLSHLGEELKHWSVEDLTINENIAEAPLLQEETLSFPCGICEIEVKWIDENGKLRFGRKIRDSVVHRNDRTIVGE